jgi:lipid II:glycine glycyltransferase (peptidoglycan interpeptide bridge formation enzyme)
MGYVANDRLTDVLAASDPQAERCYANYLALWTLFEAGRTRGARVCDLGGIDPRGNHGVYLFKRGLKGRVSPRPVYAHSQSPGLTHLFSLKDLL